MEGLVSCIVVFHNCEQYIKEAIESVVDQTYDNWELLLVDDGSIDDSRRICETFRNSDPHRILILDHEGQENRGISISRKLGIACAKGEYIAFLDADDVWLANKIEAQVRIMENYRDVDLVIGPALYWFSWKSGVGATGSDRMRRVYRDFSGVVKWKTLVIGSFKRYLKFPQLSSVLFRKLLFEKMDFEAEFTGMYEDQALYCKLPIHANVYVGSTFLDKYRIHPASITAKSRKTNIYRPHGKSLSHQAFLNWARRYFSETKIDDRELWNALEYAELKYTNYGKYIILRVWYYFWFRFVSNPLI